MKWMYLIIVLMVGAMLIYGLFFMPAPKGTLHSTAEAFVAAALKGNMEQVRSLCTSDCVASAEELARQIQAAKPHPRSFGFQPSLAQPPHRALTGMFQGRPITLEMIKQGEEWKIAAIGM
jgi:hypothetical protein